ncbi:MAG: hypothetical protein ACK4K9_08065 [Bacteroidia bacterium]
MKTKTFTKLFIPAILLLLTGCTTYTYYHPVTHIVPKVENNGDLQVYGGLGTSDYFSHYNIQAVYATDSLHFFSTNIHFNANRPYFTDSAGMKQYGSFRSSNYVDLGYGKRVYDKDGLRVNMQGTVGFGNTYNERVTNFIQGYRNLNYVKLNFVPSASFRSKIVEIGAIAKVGAIFITKLEDKAQPLAMVETAFSEYKDDFVKLNSSRNIFDFQPAGFFALGYKDYKFFGQVTLLQVSSPKLRHDDVYLSLGLNILIRSKDLKEY